jgi:hypothetical protein
VPQEGVRPQPLGQAAPTTPARGCSREWSTIFPEEASVAPRFLSKVGVRWVDNEALRVVADGDGPSAPTSVEAWRKGSWVPAPELDGLDVLKGPALSEADLSERGISSRDS